MIFWPVLYFGLYIYYLLKAYNFVHAAPWSDFKIANLMVRLHVSPSLPWFAGPMLGPCWAPSTAGVSIH